MDAAVGLLTVLIFRVRRVAAPCGGELGMRICKRSKYCGVFEESVSHR